ncbi:MAG: hypothetical protein SGPRY_005096 [Prymnesium sp.]
MGSSEEVRHCIRALVGIIRSASQGSSPVDEAQLAHLRKVVRLLSLNDEQIAAMKPEDREQVCAIRRNAIQKMLLANSVHKGDQYAASGLSPPSIIVQQPSSPMSQPASFTSRSASLPMPQLVPSNTPFPMAPPPIPARSLPSSYGFGATDQSSSSMPPPPIPRRPSNIGTSPSQRSDALLHGQKAFVLLATAEDGDIPSSFNLPHPSTF